MNKNKTINYLEIPAQDLVATKAFFADLLGWEYTDYGPDYTAVNNANIDLGFFQAPLSASTTTGSVLVVLYADDLEALLNEVESAGGSIIKPIFDFPGGRRFHFADPSGNELAIWSDNQ